MSNEKNRQSNIECLRILAMLLIVAHHFSVHGGGNFLEQFTTNYVWTEFISSGGKVGVNLFVLITGYFCINKNPKISNIIFLWLNTFFYSTSLYLIFLCFGREFNLSECIKAFIPFTFNQYWFVTCYATLFILIPFINIFTRNATKEQYFKLLVILLVLWSVIPSLIFIPPLYGNKWYFSSLGWFILLYLVSGYIRLYGLTRKITNKKLFTITGIMLFVIFVWIIFCNIQFSIGNTWWRHLFYFSEMNSITIFLISVSIFCLFLKIQVNNNYIINFIASCMFGVYLIHDNNYVRPWLWKNFWEVSNHMSIPSLKFILWSIYVICTTFVICIFIEALKKLLFNKISRLLR